MHNFYDFKLCFALISCNIFSKIKLKVYNTSSRENFSHKVPCFVKPWTKVLNFFIRLLEESNFFKVRFLRVSISQEFHFHFSLLYFLQFSSYFPESFPDFPRIFFKFSSIFTRISFIKNLKLIPTNSIDTYYAQFLRFQIMICTNFM